MSNSPQDSAPVDQMTRPALKAVETPAVTPAVTSAKSRRRAVLAKARPKPVAVPLPGAAAKPAPETRVARARPRHYVALLSFVLLVLLPFAGVVGYLFTRAADQYHSQVAFSIRSEDAGASAAGILGAITQIGSGSASDTDIVFEFIRSQQMVEGVDAELDLRSIYNKAADDPAFSLGNDASIESLLGYWRRMVDVQYESHAGIINIRANAFTPEDAQGIAEAILAKSSALVNHLSEQAREDAIRHAREDLAEAEAQLHDQRQELTSFRRANRIVDPSADVAGQMGLLNALQAELAQGLVERDMLLTYAGDTDQRVIQANRKIDAITARIEAERTDLGTGAAGGEALPEVIGAYEGLLVDLEFANTAYTQTLASLAAARAEARRQSRYLAPHIEPTRAERALYPRRPLLAGLTGLFLLLGWGVLMLVYYNVRDSR